MASVTEIGFGRIMGRKLHAVGISSAEEPHALGSQAAVMRLKTAYPETYVAICTMISMLSAVDSGLFAL